MSQFGGGGGAPPTPWYKENPFWGATGLFVTFLLTGVGFGVSGHLTLGRWLLAGAWPCGVMAIWLALNGLTNNRPIRIGGKIAAVLVLGLILTLSAVWMGRSNMTAIPSAQHNDSSEAERTTKAQSPSNASPSPVSKTRESPIERTAKFTVMVPFDTAPNTFPIPADDNPDDPLFYTYTELHSLAMNGTMPEAARESAGPVTWNSRPISMEEAPTFLGRLLQYYIFRSIDSLQHNSITSYVGYPAEANAGIEPPDAEVYPYKNLSRELADNAFFRPFLNRRCGDDMTWKMTPSKMPKGMEIKFITQKPDKYLVRFQRPAYFKADFVVQHFLGTGVGQIPKHFASKSAGTIMQWAFVVTMKYRIEHPDDDEFNPGNYAQWLDALYDGLHKKLEIDQGEKRSR